MDNQFNNLNDAIFNCNDKIESIPDLIKMNINVCIDKIVPRLCHEICDSIHNLFVVNEDVHSLETEQFEEENLEDFLVGGSFQNSNINEPDSTEDNRTDENLFTSYKSCFCQKFFLFLLHLIWFVCLKKLLFFNFFFLLT